MKDEYPDDLGGAVDRLHDAWLAVWVPLRSVTIEPLVDWLTRRLERR